MKKTALENRKFRRFALLAIILSFGIGVFFYASDSHALRLTLKRITFEGPKRTEVITVINNESKPKTYRMGWRHMRMTEDKALVYVEDLAANPDIKPVDDLVRYAPRRVTIPPGGSQQVRLMLRKPRDLADGEYRSHFWIQPEADAVKFEEREAAQGAGVQLRMLTGVTIPVIVRNGKLSATGSIENGAASIQGSNIEVRFTMVRQGDSSLYGDMEMTCLGQEQQTSRTIRGVAVYPEVQRRNMKFNIPVPADVTSCNQIGVIYREPAGANGDLGTVIAETTISLS